MAFLDFLRTLKVTPLAITMGVNSATKLTINRRASFSSLAPHIATVDSGGQIRAYSGGKTAIIVTDLETQQQVIVSVTVYGQEIPVPSSGTTPLPPTTPIPTTSIEERVARIERHLGL